MVFGVQPDGTYASMAVDQVPLLVGGGLVVPK